MDAIRNKGEKRKKVKGEKGEKKKRMGRKENWSLRVPVDHPKT